MPMEENHDFLKEKQEHPTYPKRERLPEKEKPAEEKPDEKNKKKKEDDQLSLF